MTHPLTPPPEQLQFWKKQYYGWKKGFNELLTEVAQWGWDQREPEIQADVDAELEACVQTLKDQGLHNVAADLHAARRPKPPSLKEQALEALDRMDQFPNLEDRQIVRRALEALND